MSSFPPRLVIEDRLRAKPVARVGVKNDRVVSLHPTSIRRFKTDGPASFIRYIPGKWYTRFGRRLFTSAFVFIPSRRRSYGAINTDVRVTRVTVFHRPVTRNVFVVASKCRAGLPADKHERGVFVQRTKWKSRVRRQFENVRGTPKETRAKRRTIKRENFTRLPRRPLRFKLTHSHVHRE